MTDQTVGFAAAALFIGVVCYIIYLTTKWGAATKKREAEEERTRTAITTPSEDGTPIHIVCDPNMTPPQPPLLP